MPKVPSTRELTAKKAAGILGMLTEEDCSWVSSWHEDALAEAKKARPTDDFATGFGSVLGLVLGASALILGLYSAYKYFNPTIPTAEPCPICKVCATPSVIDWRNVEYQNGMAVTDSISGQKCMRYGDATTCVDTHEKPKTLPVVVSP